MCALYEHMHTMRTAYTFLGGFREELTGRSVRISCEHSGAFLRGFGAHAEGDFVLVQRGCVDRGTGWSHSIATRAAAYTSSAAGRYPSSSGGLTGTGVNGAPTR
jgi:hypothetical protein